MTTTRTDVIWYLVQGESPTAPAVEPGAVGVEIPADVLAWAEEAGLDEDDPDVYMLVGLADDARGPIGGQIEALDGTVSADEAALISDALADDAAWASEVRDSRHAADDD